MNRKIIDQDINSIINSCPELMELKNKKILITGANGFIPAYMVETISLLNEDYGLGIEVYALVRSETRAKNRFSHFLGKSWFNIIVQDVSDEIKIDASINYIIHAASQASPLYYKTDPVGTLLANTKGTYNILEFARKNINSIDSVLFFSSAEVYGNLSNDVQYVSENDFGPLNCCELRACYAESKRMGETMCISWESQYSIPCKIVRIFHTYGPGMDLNDGRVFADFVRSAVQGKNIEMKSDGSAIRAFCYLSDAINAIFKVLLCGETSTAYNIGNESCEVSIRSLAYSINELSTNKKSTVIISGKDDNYIPSTVNRIVPNTEKLRALGW
ncbi:TPA: NAD-dependent epimerase/dehydratase family protein, partial [Yersinia enterocolitica]|nr:NAD-dependent epimerase/dehydratase family protein [Yersinia enterocolitica]